MNGTCCIRWCMPGGPLASSVEVLLEEGWNVWPWWMDLQKRCGDVVHFVPGMFHECLHQAVLVPRELVWEQHHNVHVVVPGDHALSSKAAESRPPPNEPPAWRHSIQNNLKGCQCHVQVINDRLAAKQNRCTCVWCGCSVSQVERSMSPARPQRCQVGGCGTIRCGTAASGGVCGCARCVC